jgi:very-short-patch-repair endonuclease
MAAVLWGGDGTAASHRCSGLVWELDGVPPGFIEISRVGGSRKSNPRVIVHRLEDPFTIHRVGGIPVTSAVRTLVDLCAVLSESKLELAVEDALRRRLISLGRLDAAVTRARGRRGVASLRRIIAARRDDPRPTDTLFEAKLLQELARNAFPRPRAQYVVQLEGRTTRLDFAYPEARVGIEADSYQWHSGRRAWENDRARLSALTAAGWQVLHVTNEELQRGGSELMVALRRLLGQRHLFAE